MTAPYVEHQNITVPNLSATIDALLALFPAWRLRARRREFIQPTFGNRPFELDWAHVGTEHSYLALQAPPDNADFIPNPQPYFSHLGIVVTDLAACLQRAERLGLLAKESPPHPGRRRAYVQVATGLMLELIEYQTEDQALRHSYS
ncbi:MAG: VOC family protein [Pseudomonadota bacterium]|uniref:Glyoxalase/bleomycin resistance protein/dioxygenase superfamily protein n=1 Tax=Gallaecimonas pentaromativorans TaxID=584787 RepID=A0A3N1NQ61_9GAMM|nr:VOC family protein [Gallaecimonas pentaromativorans]MED5525687.1 VOC family protein [Pseudomonadota bacterium]ROQ21914.1 glyoxalase/bleomycin resistance protein/dioxygenase superfamily protein [Gallaecimonas pentaromativorans]